MADRRTILTVTTPLEQVPTVVCYEDTWQLHVDQIRRDIGTAAIQGTLEGPAMVVQGTTNPGYLAFVSGNVTSPGGHSPFAVFVDPDGNPLPAVASFGYRRDFKDLTKHTTLWMPKPKP